MVILDPLRRIWRFDAPGVFVGGSGHRGNHRIVDRAMVAAIAGLVGQRRDVGISAYSLEVLGNGVRRQ